MCRAWSVRLMTAGMYFYCWVFITSCVPFPIGCLIDHVHCRLESRSVICKRVTIGFLAVNLRYIIVFIFKVVSRGNWLNCQLRWSKRLLGITKKQNKTKQQNKTKKTYVIEVIYFLFLFSCCCCCCFFCANLLRSVWRDKSNAHRYTRYSCRG